MVSPFTIVLPAIYMSLSLLSLNYFKVSFQIRVRLLVLFNQRDYLSQLNLNETNCSIVTIQVLYTLFTKLVYAKISNPLYKAYVQPALSQGLTFTQHSLGPAEKLNFSLNHVLMMTVVLVLMVELGRLRAAIKSRR